MLSTLNAERFVFKLLSEEELKTKFHHLDKEIWDLMKQGYSILYLKDYGRRHNSFSHYSGNWLEMKLQELLGEFFNVKDDEIEWMIVDQTQIDEDILYVAFKIKKTVSW